MLLVGHPACKTCYINSNKGHFDDWKLASEVNSSHNQSIRIWSVVTFGCKWTAFILTVRKPLHMLPQKWGLAVTDRCPCGTECINGWCACHCVWCFDVILFRSLTFCLNCSFVHVGKCPCGTRHPLLHIVRSYPQSKLKSDLQWLHLVNDIAFHWLIAC